MTQIHADKLRTAARAAAKEVLATNHRMGVYSVLAGIQCIRHWIRLVFMYVFAFFGVRSYFSEKVLLRSALETQRIALMRDMGEDPLSSSPLATLKKSLRFSQALKQFAQCKDTSEAAGKILSYGETFSGEERTAYEWFWRSIQNLTSSLPTTLLANGFYGKVARATVGVVSYCLHKDRTYSLDKATQIGFWFGVLYLFDELLDIPDLTSEEEKRWTQNRVRTFLCEGQDHAVTTAPGPVALWIDRALQEICILCPRGEYANFYTCLTLLADAQNAEFSEQSTMNPEDVYTLLALKSGLTRLIPATLAGWELSDKYIRYAMTTGIANQLIDDFRDFHQDSADGVPTPFVRYSRQELTEHPLTTYFRALEASVSTFENNKLLIRTLWAIRLTHGLRVLALKSAKQKTPPPIWGLWRLYAASSGVCHSVIVDMEAILAIVTSDMINQVAKQTISVISH